MSWQRGCRFPSVAFGLSMPLRTVIAYALILAVLAAAALLLGRARRARGRRPLRTKIDLFGDDKG
jgi:hypothetical protein